jgi:hypothetical protein
MQRREEQVMTLVRTFLGVVLALTLGLALPAELTAQKQKKTSRPKVSPQQKQMLQQLRKKMQQAKKQSQKAVHHRSHLIKGVVVHVHHNKKHRSSGTIKVRSGSKKKQQGKSALSQKNSGRRGRTHTVHVTHSTHFVRVTGASRGKTTLGGRAHFRDVHLGQHVRVRVDHGRHAHMVGIMANQTASSKPAK